ncbi:MAG TPA: biopolymer transporter ExbD [Opitutaceae bacterium]|nr:biopolymer transporter ExbD [Opitutaceae bacterium]
MARIFRRKHTAQPIADLNVTNMIDLGFTLLIIFMITTSYSQQEQTIAVKLPPEAKSIQQKPDPESRVETISIDARGNYFLGGKAVSFRDLQVQLHVFATEPKQPIIRIAGDVAGSYGKIAAVITELKRQNLSRIDIATEAER